MKLQTNRYDRHKLIAGWDQKLLEEKSIAIIGSESLSDFLVVDALSLGIGQVYRIGSSNTFDFERINPEIYFQQDNINVSSSHDADRLIGDVDFVVDATHNYRSKHYSKIAAEKKGKGWLSCFASRGEIGFSNSLDEKFCSEKAQSYENSIVLAGIVSDEIRKRFLILENEVLQEEYRLNTPLPTNLTGRFLQVGAGAIGTFTALALAKKGADLTIMDYDNVETSNLNRQFLFYDSDGINKACALAQKIKNICPNVRGINSKFVKESSLEGYDFILSCVDNDPTRHIINELAKEKGIPVINGGSSTFAGVAMPYFPGKTECLDCQTAFSLSESITEEAKKRERNCFHPSIINSNQIVGGLMAICLNEAISNRFVRYNYRSGFGISYSTIQNECFNECKNGR